MALPKEPNYLGTFDIRSHSGPWTYLQRVPLVLYGPGHIAGAGSIERPVTLADVFPTVSELTHVDLPERAGERLDEAIRRRSRSPKLILTVVWDGAGRNVLERWPDAWPVLARLESEGASYLNATVGSSPSITPATHSTLGTGSFPDEHRVTGIGIRDEGGRIRTSFSGRSPDDLYLTTFGDEIDRALDNAPKVGMLAWRAWHLGMLGHGSALEGGDRDELGIIGYDSRVTGNPRFYSTPSFLKGFPGLDTRMRELDIADGVEDGLWRGHEIAALHDNPSWARYQTDVLLEMMRRGGYGADPTVDLMFTNYKMTDIVGHRYSMDSPEMADVLRSQDEELGRLISYLDEEVGDYVVIVTADHGHTPSAEASGAWPIDPGELREDVDREFGVSPADDLLERNSPVGFFLDREVADSVSATDGQVANFLNGYTLGANAGDEIPSAYSARSEEKLYEAAWPASGFGRVLSCAGL
jgi:hypothetical protein